MWELRPAREEDITQLSELARRIFHDTFSPYNSDADMELYYSQAFTPSVMAEELSDPGTDIILALSDGRPVAYAQLHRGDAPAQVTGRPAIELKRFYVLASWHGTGLARDLMRSVVARSLEHGAKTLWLGVWEHNPRAIRFYGKLGFDEVGEQPFTLGTDLQRDLIMAVPLDAIDALLGDAAGERMSRTAPPPP